MFDILSVDGLDLRNLPLRQRKTYLSELVPRFGIIRYADEVPTQGEALFSQVRLMGLEGIMAKEANSTYQSGHRSRDWLKIRSDRKQSFTIVGYRLPKAFDRGVGSIHVAMPREEGWAYAGRVGSGFSENDRKELEISFKKLIVKDYPFGEPPSSSSERDTWLQPQMRCEVRYKEWTAGGNLRHPVFLGLLPDDPSETTEGPPLPTVNKRRKPTRPTKIQFSNREKIFWPQSGTTKGEMIDYYEAVAKFMLPYLADRPLVLDRYPDGILGKSFYQKNAPEHAPTWIPTLEVWSGDPPRAIEYFVCNDSQTLLYLANLGAIPFHLWASRVGELDRPDWCIVDLDPKDAPFSNVITLALATRDLCREIDLPCYVKTSGSTGLHILIPLGGTCDYTQSRLLAELISRVVNSRWPKISTLARSLTARGGPRLSRLPAEPSGSTPRCPLFAASSSWSPRIDPTALG